jgi:dCTP deaminase
LIQAAERKMKGDAAVTLSAQSIRVRCLECAPPLITPFVERSVSPGGRSFGLGPASYDVRIDQDVIIPPHGFMLASTVEYFHMPNDLAGTVRDKSTWARVGLAVQNTHLDPGWPGYLTLELSNHSDAEIRIARGEPIAQIVFEMLDQPTELPYRGKYYNQERGPQSARHENDPRRGPDDPARGG